MPLRGRADSSGALRRICAIGVDEISFGRWHRHLIVVVELLQGDVIRIGKGCSAESLEARFAEVGSERRAMLEVVTIDLLTPLAPRDPKVGAARGSRPRSLPRDQAAEP